MFYRPPTELTRYFNGFSAQAHGSVCDLNKQAACKAALKSLIQRCHARFISHALVDYIHFARWLDHFPSTSKTRWYHKMVTRLHGYRFTIGIGDHVFAF